jgi:hypothetical protein
MTAGTDESQVAVAAAPACVYCRQPFTPKTADQLYCCPTHRSKAKRKRKNGLDPAVLPQPASRCGWCDTLIEARSPDMRYCSPEHRQHARVCDRKQAFLTEDAAIAMAVRLTTPGLRGVLEHYRCQRAGDLHWHLYSDDKRQAKERARTREELGEGWGDERRPR